MASLRTTSLVMLFLLFSTAAVALEFDVGDEEGWVVPKSKDESIYNHWASKNRFRVGDTVRKFYYLFQDQSFKYKKDSVMVVTEEEYKECKSLHPAFFSNTGDSVYKLDHSGTFYFISGVAGHCERGQKMIVKVLAHSDAPGGSPAGNHTSPPSPKPSGAEAMAIFSGFGLTALLMGTLFMF